MLEMEKQYLMSECLKWIHTIWYVYEINVLLYGKKIAFMTACSFSINNEIRHAEADLDVRQATAWGSKK